MFARPRKPPVCVVALVGAILCFTASAASAEEPLKLADSQLEPVKWTELAGWTADDHIAAFAAYQTSCQALRKTQRADDHGPVYGALLNVCRKASDCSRRIRKPPAPSSNRIFNPCASRVWARSRDS